MKFAASLFAILLFINSTMLFFQYHVYSSNTSDSEQYVYEQEIEIIYRPNKLFVRQHFSALPKDEVKIVWPLQSEKHSCYLKNNDSCSRLNEELSRFNASEVDAQSVSYEIPLPNGLVSGALLQNLFATLQKGQASFTSISISDETKAGGMWVSGLPTIGQKSLDNVDFTLFSGSGQALDLYWSKTPLPYFYRNNDVTIFTNTELSNETKNALDQLQLPNLQHVVIIESNQHTPVSSNRILFRSTIDPASIENELILSYLNSQYVFDRNSNKWIPEVVGSFVLNRSIGSKKSKEMVSILENYMTPTQIDDWTRALNKLKGEAISPKTLDQILSKTLKLNTSFFTLNSADEKTVAPLLFEDARTVYINELQQDSMKVVFKDGRVLYSVEPLLSTLGYQVQLGENGFYVRNDSRSFRFPMDEPFYVYNERRYDILSQPIEKLGEAYYIEEAWLVRLFLVDLEKSDHRINIKPSAVFE